ncbi:MAG: hypothetical protein IJX69_01000 [Oscillospiraceae bacterium]|nr:hypothetical protein [Oscillospiraceae bacterium]
MKKLIPVLIAIVLLAATAVNAYAATPTQIRFSAANTAVQPGDTIDFTVTMDEVADCRSAGIVLQYDSGALEFVSGQCLASNPVMADFSGGTGVFAFAEGKTVSGTIFKFTLRLKDSAAYGSYTISASATVRNSSGQIDTQVLGTSVTFSCDHTYGAWTNADADFHHRTCSNCGASQGTIHTWKDSTVTKAPTCQDEGEKTFTCADCGATKSQPIAKTDAHTYGAWENAIENNHSHTCSLCGKEESAAHTWDSGKVTKNPTCKTEGQKTYTCAACGATKSESITKTDAHTYGAWENANENNHSHACSLCGKAESAAHTWDSGKVTMKPTCKTEGQKTFSCTACGAIKSESIAKLTSHTYDSGCDTACNLCGAAREAKHQYSSKWSSDDTNHWHRCTVCGKKADSAAHIPGKEATESTPQTCTVCGYVIKAALGHRHSLAETLAFDESGHWYACSGCSQQEFTAHTFDNDCDTTCDTCDYIREVSHTMNQEWSADADSHWHECGICGHSDDHVAHIPGGEATAEAPQVCTVCGYELAAMLEVTEPAEDAEEPDEAAPQDTPAEEIRIQEEAFTFPWWLAVAALAVVGGAVTVICLVVKRK